MNNLLRTLTESQVKPGADLKLLLTAVKETRRQCYDNKLSDAFYESLDNLLTDLRTITIDNRDAEAFLKPVSKAEVPDYYDYITQPMDLATMGKKVKAKQYKSKREFKDDLDLIWSNCYKYNAAEDHPLRLCVDRLKVKAERLLKHITDRKDRTDPSIPFELAPQAGIARPKLNGMVNGTSRLHTRTPSTTIPNGKPTPQPRKTNLPFADSPAIVRTPEGMVSFRELDRRSYDEVLDSKVVQRLKALAPHVEILEEKDDFAMTLDGLTGDKRKLNGVSEGRPRKRARFATLPDDLAQLWWHVVENDSMVGNGLPEIPYALSSQHQLSLDTDKRPKRRKRKMPPTSNSKSLLNLMNNNIKTLRRVNQTHLKIISATVAINDDPDGDGGFSTGPSTSITSGFQGNIQHHHDAEITDKIDERHWVERVKAKRKGRVEIGEGSARDCISWMGEKVLEHSGFQGTSKGALDVLTSVASEYLLNVGRTIRFLSDKYSHAMSPEEIVLHTLFESGVSKVQELERYISDDIERYGAKLVEMEKKLTGHYRDLTAGHEALEDEGLFDEEDEEETGALAIGDFADSLGEDYLGLRELGIADEFGLTNLSIPKSLLRQKKSQKLAVSKPEEKPLDYPLPPPFLPFTLPRAEEQIGLLKSYYQSRFQQLSDSRPTPPPPPQMLSGMPPLPGLSVKLPSLPGPSLPSLPGPSLPPLPGPSLTTPYPPIPYPTPTTGSSNASTSTSQPPEPPRPSPIPPDLALPDDPVPPSQAKMGPIGQIIKPNVSASSKKKPKATSDEAGGGSGGIAPSTSTGATGSATFVPTVVGPNGFISSAHDGPPKKKKGTTGGGSGNGRKKKDRTPGTSSIVLPISAAPSQASSNGGHPNQGHNGGGRGTLPSAVVARV